MMASRRGAFITLEGIEGVGKTTLIGHVMDCLRAAGLPALKTREPGGTPLAEAIRGLLIADCPEGMDADTELLLMFAARNQHLVKKIRPALEEGRWVVSDRFTDASYAYQGGGRGIDAERIRTLECFVQRGLQPDLTLLLDAPAGIGLARAGRRQTQDRFEREARAFFERVRSAYLDRAAEDPRRFHIIDASQPLPAVKERVEAVVRKFASDWSETP